MYTVLGHKFRKYDLFDFRFWHTVSVMELFTFSMTENSGPPDYSEETYPHIRLNGWRMHVGSGWLYNVVAGTFCHIETRSILVCNSD